MLNYVKTKVQTSFKPSVLSQKDIRPIQKSISKAISSTVTFVSLQFAHWAKYSRLSHNNYGKPIYLRLLPLKGHYQLDNLLNFNS